jgi:toxin YoeB
MRELLWSVGAWDDYLELQTDKAALKKVNKLLKDVMRNGYQASYGKVEMLKGNFRGYASVLMGHQGRHRFWIISRLLTVRILQKKSFRRSTEFQDDARDRYLS